MNRKILVTGGKGGVGKTTVTACLGLALARRGARTVIVDGDIGLNNLDLHLRVENRILYDIGDIADGTATVSQSLVRIEKNLYFLPSSTANSSRVSEEDFRRIVSDTSKNFTYLLIDCPAGIERSFARAAKCAEEGIVVTTPHLSGIRDGYKTGKVLLGLGYKTLHLVVNRVKNTLTDKNGLTGEEIENAMKIPLLGIVPESTQLDVDGIIEKEKSEAYRAFFRMADYLMGNEKTPLAVEKNTLWEKIKKKIIS